jgi:hypothetical protein
MIITQLRTYLEDKTIGRLFVDGRELDGITIEDVGRPAGCKIQDETCIPEGIYLVRVTHSNRFKKPMMILFNVATDLSVRDGPVMWTGIRVHSGTTVEHTAGCVLFKDYEPLQAQVVAEIATGKPVYWVIARKL